MVPPPARPPGHGLVVDALGPLVLSGALDLNFFWLHRIEQEAHAIRLQPEHLLQLVGRHGFNSSWVRSLLVVPFMSPPASLMIRMCS